MGDRITSVGTEPTAREAVRCLRLASCDFYMERKNKGKERKDEFLFACCSLLPKYDFFFFLLFGSCAVSQPNIQMRWMARERAAVLRSSWVLHRAADSPLIKHKAFFLFLLDSCFSSFLLPFGRRRRHRCSYPFLFLFILFSRSFSGFYYYPAHIHTRRHHQVCSRRRCQLYTYFFYD